MYVVDPEEIRLYRRLQNMMLKYIVDPNDKTPLGLAVFGAPGSGKSFGIKQVGDAISKTAKKDIKLVECNLAQFTSADDLGKKLLEARNYSMEGQYPIIFLDEFDSPFGGKEPFGWFKHLLALIQDGTFLYQGVLCYIQKAFVVCAGGLNRSFQEFEWKSRHPDFRHAKIPDLLSRLRGYVNIKGPNPYFPYPSITEPFVKEGESFEIPTLEGYTPILGKSKQEQEERVKKLANYDPLYKIRRAVLLRNILKSKMPYINNEKSELAVSQNVLRAF